MSRKYIDITTDLGHIAEIEGCDRTDLEIQNSEIDPETGYLTIDVVEER